MLKKSLFFSFFFVFAFQVAAQYARKHWFAIPHFTELHADVPVYLILKATAYAGQYQVTNPATRQTYFNGNLDANQTLILNFTPFVAATKPLPFNAVHRTGLLIESTAPIAAFFEVMGDASANPGPADNTEIFVLKGENALGNEFVLLPSSFGHQQNINAFFNFAVVATEDNTVLEVIPKQSLFQVANVAPYQVVLQKGEVYSQRSLGSLANNKLRPGLRLKANKPIAVSQNDDSILRNNAWDSSGDQLVPTEKAGNEYFLLKSRLNLFNFDPLVEFVVYNHHPNPIEIDIFLNQDSSTTLTVLADSFLLLRNIEMALLKSAQNFSVYQTDFYSSEASGALVPPFACNLSNEVVYAKTTNDEHFVAVLVEKGKENELRVNGNPFLPITSIDFENNGLGKNYVLLTADFNNLNVGSTLKITCENTPFLCQIMAGNPLNGQRLGYLSPHSRFVLPDSLTLCPQDKATLNATNSDSGFLWNTGETTQSIEAEAEGLYSVSTSLGGCNRVDEVIVKKFNVNNQLLPDTIYRLCEGNRQSISLLPGLNLRSFQWQNGSRNMVYVASQTETVKVVGVETNGCPVRDSILVFFNKIPNSSITASPNQWEEICQAEKIRLQATSISDTLTYFWSTGEPTSSIEVLPNPRNTYSLSVTDPIGCSSSSSYLIDCSSFLGQIPNIITPNGDGFNEIFEIKNFEKGTWNLKLFNRFGTLVAEKKNYENNFSASNLDSGVYFYFLEHNFSERTEKGWLEVKK